MIIATILLKNPERNFKNGINYKWNNKTLKLLLYKEKFSNFAHNKTAAFCSFWHSKIKYKYLLLRDT